MISLAKNVFAKPNLLNIASILLVFLPISIISGPLVPEMIILAINIFFLIENHSIKKIKSYLSYIVYILLLFNILIILSSLLSSNVIFSLKSSFFFFRFILFTMSVIWILKNNKKISLYMFYSLSFSFLLLFVLLIPELIFNYNILNGVKEGLIKDDYGNFTGHAYMKSKNSSLFGDEWVMGSYISRLFPFYIALFYLNKNYISTLIKKKIIFILLICTFCIYFSGERMALFLHISSLLLFFIFLKFSKKTKAILLLIFSILILILSTQNTQNNRMFKSTYDQIYSEGKIFFYSKDHESHFISAYNIFLDNKFFGVGPKNFRNECGKNKFIYNEYSCSTHPHNILIQLLSEVGIFGSIIPLGIFLWTVLEIIKNFFTKQSKKTNFKTCFLCFYFISLLPLVPSGNIFNNWLSIIMFLPLPFYLNSLKQK